MAKQGKLLGMPFDWRKPTVARFKSRVWDPENPKLFVPKVYGWGYSVNFARLLRRH